MARRKTHKRKTHRRRRSSISGVGKSDFMQIALIIGGAVAGRVITSKLGSKVNPKILAGGQIAAGLFLPKMIKNKMVAGLATGLAVNGGVSLLQSFGVIGMISGIGDNSTEMEYLSGTDQLAALAGSDDDYLNGIDQGIMTGVDTLESLAGGNDWNEVLSGYEED